MSTDPARDMFSLREIAARTGLSIDTIKREVKAGRLRSTMIGRRRLINKEWYDAWRLTHNPGPAAPAAAAATARAAGARPEAAGATVYPWDRPRTARGQ